MFEATEISKFTNDGHGSDFLEPFASHEGVNHRLPFPGFKNGLHVFFEPFDTLDAGVDGLEILFEDHFVSLIGQSEFSEVAHVCRRPFGFARVMESIAKEEGVEPLFGAGEIVARISSRSADISDSFIKSRRNANLSDVAIAEELGDVHGVAFVGLDLFVWFAFGLGRSHDETIDLELSKASCEDEAGGAGFVTDFKILKTAIELLGKGAESALNGGVAAATGPVEDGLGARVGGRVGNGDRILVDVEPDVVDCFHGVLRYDRLYIG